jgi:hypothetical protein
LSSPTSSVRPSWRAASGTTRELPLPPRLTTTPTLAAESEALAEAWTRAKEGQRQLVLADWRRETGG